MKLKTTVGELLDAFALVSPTLDSKGSSSNLYLNANDKSGYLYLYSTNLSSETATKVKATEVEESGEVLVASGKLVDGLGGLSKNTAVSIALTPTGNSLKVQASTVKFTLATNTSVRELGDRMKAIPAKSTPTVVIPAAELAEFSKRSTFCIPNDQTGQRANLAALKLSTTDDKEEAFATDGSIAVHVASSKKQSSGDGFGTTGLLIPVNSLSALSSIVSKKSKEKVSVILNDKKSKVFFKFADGTIFGTQVLVLTYPNLKAITEQPFTYQFNIPREPFKQSLLRANSFVSSGISKKVLELEIGAEMVTLKANGSDSLSDTIPITYKGNKPTEPVKLGVNIDYLFNIAASASEENLTIGFTSNEKPLIISDKKGEEGDEISIKYVVMGIKINT